MRKYLVTGAAGFIGSAVAKRLLEQGNMVVTVDNLSTGKRENVPDGCEFIIGDCQDSKTIAELDTYRFDSIIHIAGQSSGEVSFEDPVYDLQTNAQSTIMLLAYAKKTGCKNFVYASSMSVYGDQEKPFVSEKTPICPKSFYAVGKMASEHYMRIYSDYGIKCTALRFFNVYGIGQNMDNLKQGMASIYLAMALKDKYIVVKGNKDRFRDFVYIDDVVDAVIKADERTDTDGFKVYNVSTGEKTTVENVIKEIKRNMPFPVTETYTDGTPGDQMGVYGDNSKIRTELKWNPEYTFKNGIEKMVKWALQYKFERKVL